MENLHLLAVEKLILTSYIFSQETEKRVGNTEVAVHFMSYSAARVGET